MAEEKNIATGHIGNALRSTAADHTTTFADEIFDTERQKYQNEVNTDIETKIASETARAKAAEEANAQAIADEVARAQEAELENTTAIEAEKERAETAEQANHDKLIELEGKVIGDSLSLNVPLKEGKTDTGFVPIGKVIASGSKAKFSISGGEPTFIAFYNSAHTQRTDNLVGIDEVSFPCDCDNVRIEIESAKSEDILFSITLLFSEGLDGSVKELSAKVKTLEESVKDIPDIKTNIEVVQSQVQKIDDTLYGKSIELNVTIGSGKKDSGFAPMGLTIPAGTTANVVIEGGEVSWCGFYNASMNQRSSGQDGNTGTQTFPVDCVFARIETANPVSEDTSFKVTLDIAESKGLVANFDSLSDNVNLLNGDYKLYYGNLDASGNPETDVRNNRVHSSLFDIDVVKNISCSSDYNMGFILRDKDGTFLYRQWNDGDTSFDTLVASTHAIGAKYIQLLIAYYPDASIVFDLENNPPIINVEPRTKLDRKDGSLIKMGINATLPTIIFNFDDCFPEGDEKVAELFEQLGVRCGFAFIASEDNIAKKSALYLDLQKRGFNILNHSSDVLSINESNYTFETAKDNITTALGRLQRKGFIVNGFVCPNSELSESFKPIVNKTHAYNFIGSKGGVYGSNDKSTNVGDLLRWGLQGHSRTEIKAYIDECISSSKCLILYGHTIQFGNDASDADWTIDKVRDILNYCIEKRNNLECYIGGCDDAIKYYFGL